MDTKEGGCTCVGVNCLSVFEKYFLFLSFLDLYNFITAHFSNTKTLKVKTQPSTNTFVFHRRNYHDGRLRK